MTPIELEPTATPEQIKFKLVKLLDELMLISNQKVWEQLATPELQKQYQQAIDAVDTVWWNWRNQIGFSED